MLKFIVIGFSLIMSEVMGFEIKFQEGLSNDAARYDVNYGDMGDTNWRYLSHYTSTGHSDHNDYTASASDSNEDNITDEESFDSWSVVWYIASFGGLIGFFLMVSCSEWCCRKRMRENQTRRTAVVPSTPSSPSSESPPPAYDLFAPPSYDTVSTFPNNEKNEYDIYVVPVHAIGSLVDTADTRQEQREHPPSYSSINMEEDRNTSGST